MQEALEEEEEEHHDLLQASPPKALWLAHSHHTLSNVPLSPLSSHVTSARVPINSTLPLPPSTSKDPPNTLNWPPMDYYPLNTLPKARNTSHLPPSTPQFLLLK